MKEKKIVRRLGDRLDHLFQWVGATESYRVIWDLCCDHGRLGLHLHQRHPNSQVILVDRVAGIIDKLREDYRALGDDRLLFKTADAAQLAIATEKRTLVIIAGVGGENVIAMLEGILSRLDTDAGLEFMLSANSRMFELRAFLRSRSFTLIDEAFVTEKNFSHEHLWLRYDSSANTGGLTPAGLEPVSAIGASLWHDMNDTKRRYLHRLLQHHQRRLHNRDGTCSDQAIQAYRPLL